MYPQPAAPVDREIQGTLASVEMRQGGWHRFSILEHGQQYPVRCDTKKQDTVQQAMSLMGQPVAAAIREQESNNINPNNNKPYINRYLNGIAPFGYAPGVNPVPGAPTPQQYQPPQNLQPQQYQPPQDLQSTYPTQPPSAPQQPVPPTITPGIMGFDKDINIMRQTAAKVVAMSLRVLPPDQQNVRGMVEACEVWMSYFLHGPLRFGVTAFGEPQSALPEEMRSTDQDGDRYITLDGTRPCPECGHTNTHAPGCPAAPPE
jgi:hypothetical protein